MTKSIPVLDPCARHVHVKGSFSSKLNMSLANALNCAKLERFREVELIAILSQSLTTRLKYDGWKVLVLRNGIYRILASLNLVRP